MGVNTLLGPKKGLHGFHVGFGFWGAMLHAGSAIFERFHGFHGFHGAHRLVGVLVAVTFDPDFSAFFARTVD